MQARDHLQRLYVHLGKIAPKKRNAFILHVLEGQTIGEVAAVVGASQTATMSRVYWARRELAKRVRKDPTLCHFLEKGEGQ